MEPTLVAVTLLSLAMAVAMGLVTWRLLRAERRRSDARVAALDDLSAVADPPGGGTASPPGRAEAETRVFADLPLRQPRTGHHPARSAPVRQPGRAAARSAPVPAVPDAVNRAPLFTATRRPGGPGYSLAIGAVTVAAVAAVIALLSMAGGPRGAAGPDPAPLELVSLHHDRDGDALVITGVVQNPRGGRDRRDVSAVAFLFDRGGTFLASGTALLDFPQLAPGGESPFRILVTGAAAVGRYRVGFRSPDGEAVGHVDRRPPGGTGRDAAGPTSARLAPGGAPK